MYGLSLVADFTNCGITTVGKTGQFCGPAHESTWISGRDRSLDEGLKKGRNATVVEIYSILKWYLKPTKWLNTCNLETC